MRRRAACCGPGARRWRARTRRDSFPGLPTLARRDWRRRSASRASPCGAPMAAPSMRVSRWSRPARARRVAARPASRISRSYEREIDAANKEFEALTSAAGHDLRAPLRILKSFIEALEDECGEILSDEGRGFLDEILKASGRMEDLIDGLLTFSRASRAELSLREPRHHHARRTGALRAAPHACRPRRRLPGRARHQRPWRRAPHDDRAAQPDRQRVEVHGAQPEPRTFAATSRSATAATGSA